MLDMDMDSLCQWFLFYIYYCILQIQNSDGSVTEAVGFRNHSMVEEFSDEWIVILNKTPLWTLFFNADQWTR